MGDDIKYTAAHFWSTDQLHIALQQDPETMFPMFSSDGATERIQGNVTCNLVSEVNVEKHMVPKFIDYTKNGTDVHKVICGDVVGKTTLDLVISCDGDAPFSLYFEPNLALVKTYPEKDRKEEETLLVREITEEQALNCLLRYPGNNYLLGL